MLFEKLLEVINKYNSFVLSTHINPDADAIGSQMAFYYLLKEFGKNVNLINHSETPYSLQFMDKGNVIEKYAPEKHNAVISSADVIVFLDMNSSNRVASMEDVCLKSDAYKIIIDHHTEPQDFADLYFVFTTYSSTGEIVYDIIKESGRPEIDKTIAEALYAAIMADTGSFHYDRTTPKIHTIAAELLECGVEPDKVYEELFEKGTLGRLKLLGAALSSLRQNNSKEITYMVITKEDMRINDAVEADIEGFVGYTLSVEGSRIGLLFYELDEGIKISFRSKGKIPANKFAEEFGGGGHLNAAGARLDNCKLSEYLPKVISAAEKYLEFN